jgi:uncharacterized protein (DUF2147 family)
MTMRGMVLTAAAIALTMASTFALAEEPIGEWLVADGDARILIEKCSDRLWGVVSWERIPGGTDLNNPDPAKRTRPTLGMPVLLGMAPSGENRWDGQFYNAQDGRTYPARISLTSSDVLSIEGRSLGCELCGSVRLERVPAAMSRGANPPTAMGGKPPAGKPPTSAGAGTRPLAAGTLQAPGGAPTITADDVCSRITGVTRTPHEDGLEQDSRRHGAPEREDEQLSHAGSARMAGQP